MYVYKIAIAVLKFLNSALKRAADEQLARAASAEERMITIEHDTHLAIQKMEARMRESVNALEEKLDEYEADAAKAQALSRKIEALTE